MKFNPAFLNLAKSGAVADNMGFSAEGSESVKLNLKLVPKEVYNQYIVVPDNLMYLLNSPISKIRIVTDEGDIVPELLGYGYKIYLDYNCIYLSFKIAKDYANQCLRLRIDFVNNTPANKLFTNSFTCNYANKEKTTIITYRHLSNHYGIPYTAKILSNNKAKWNQIRVPLYYLRLKTEQDSEESIYDVNKPSNIAVSRVQRRDLSVWRVIANDWINQRLAIVSDTDYIYFDGKRQVVRPYVWEEIVAGNNFSLSELESQIVYGDEFLDTIGMVHYVIVINDITHSGCCTPSPTRTEPKIVSSNDIAHGCATDGMAKKIVLTGLPNSTAKMRVELTAISGAVKTLRVGNVDYTFSNVGQVHDIFYYFDGSGNAEIDVKCCFEECTPYAVISASFNIGFYNYDMTTLTGQNVTMSKTTNCAIPTTAKWDVISNTGTYQNTAKITDGIANGVAKVRVYVISSLGSPPPISFVKFGALLDQNNVNTGDTWDVNVPLDGSGQSANYNLEVQNAGTWTPFNSAFISVKYVILDSNGDESQEKIILYKGLV